MLKERTSLSRSTLYYYVAQEASSPRQRRFGPRRGLHPDGYARRVRKVVAWLASEVRAWTLNRPTNRRGHPELECRNDLETIPLALSRARRAPASRFAYPWCTHEQCACADLWRKCLKTLERAKRIEPSTLSLGSWIKSLNPLGFSANRAPFADLTVQ